MDDILPILGRWDLENVDRFDYPPKVEGAHLEAI